MSRVAKNTGGCIVTPYGKWTAFGFIPMDSPEFDPEYNAVQMRLNKPTGLKLGTVLEFQRLIREHIKIVTAKIDNPKLVTEIEEINMIYIELLEHI